MRRVLILLVTFLVLGLSFVNPVLAYNTELNNRTYSTDTTITLELKASPQNKENAVSVDLEAQGLTVLNYTPPSSNEWIGTLPSCDNGQRYTATNVCVLLARQTPIPAGESLGTVTVKVEGEGMGKLVKTQKSAYSDGQTSRVDAGDLMTFNEGQPLAVVEIPTETEVPNEETPTETHTNNNYPQPTTNQNAQNIQSILPIIFGAIIIVVLLVLAAVALKKAKKAPEPQEGTVL